MKILFLVCISLAVFGLTSSAPSQSLNDTELYEAIAANLAEVYAKAKAGEDYYAADKECFPDLGCVMKNGPMHQTLTLPKSPAQIGTKFYAYTAGAHSTAHLLDAHSTASFSVVDASKRLVFLTHGFGSSHAKGSFPAVKDHLLSDTNHGVGTVVMVDWAEGAKSPMYNEAAANTQIVGRQIAHLVNELHKHHGVNPANVYLVGHSLGAQVSGFAGKWSQSEYHWKFGRITGLDAAAPLFLGHSGAFLSRADATFVDAIHTSKGKENPLDLTHLATGNLGFPVAYAHLDFFPNDGHNQPGCPSIASGCSHSRSVELYEYSVAAHAKCHFSAQACANWQSFHEHKCTAHADVEMGYYADKGHVQGVRYLSTTDKAPFCH